MLNDTTVVFASDAPTATIAGRVRRGELVRLAAGVYTSDVTSDPAAVTAREWPAIAGGMLPGAVITDRSAVTGGPVDGVRYLARDGRARDVELPGLRVTARPGAGPASARCAYADRQRSDVGDDRHITRQRGTKATFRAQFGPGT
jgi:hypothetical protein